MKQKSDELPVGPREAGSRGRRPVIEWVLAFAIVAVLLAILFPPFVGSDHGSPTTVCLSNVKQQAIAMLIYAESHDKRLPESSAWMDEIAPYVKNEEILHCVSLRDKPTAYGFAMNVGLSGRNLDDIEDVSKAVMLFESILTVRNATSGLYGFPNPPRHGRAGVLAFADGIAKPIVPNQFAEVAAESRAAEKQSDTGVQQPKPSAERR